MSEAEDFSAGGTPVMAFWQMIPLVMPDTQARQELARISDPDLVPFDELLPLREAVSLNADAIERDSDAITFTSYSSSPPAFLSEPSLYAVEIEGREQYRFPRSRKRRIRRKWAKDPRNWRPATRTLPACRIEFAGSLIEDPDDAATVRVEITLVDVQLDQPSRRLQ